MSVLDSLKDTLNKGVATVSVKSETLMESSRVKATISNTQKVLENEITILGARFYQSWKDGQEGVEPFLEALTHIQSLEQEIADLNDRLLQLKAEEEKVLGSSRASSAAPKPEGVVYCVHCGKALPAGSRFCDACGTPVA